MIVSTPIWSDNPTLPRPSLTDNVRADVAVIGGGLAGLSFAYHLLRSEPGKRLIVLEAGRIGSGASGRATGMLGPGVGQSLAGLVRRFGLEQAQALYRATLRAVTYVSELIREEQIDCDLEMTGQLVVARSKGGRDRIAKQARLLAQLELPHEVLTEIELDRVIRLAQKQPRTSRSEDGGAALRLPVAGILDPFALVEGLAARVIQRGGTIFEKTRVTRIDRGSAIRLQVEGGAEVIADQVVVATAGYTTNLGILRGRILPLHLQVLVTEPLSLKAQESIGWAGREGVLDSRRIFNYFRLTRNNQIVFGGGRPRYRLGARTDEDSNSAENALDQLRQELVQTFPEEADLRVSRGWTGVIDYVSDSLPVIHYGGKRASISHLLGWCGHGIALAVASGAWLTSLMSQDLTEDRLAWCREKPPLIPFELMRWLGFQSGVRTFSWLDRVA